MVDANLGTKAYLRIEDGTPQASLWRSSLGTTLSFMYLDWEAGISEDTGPDWPETTVIGRGEPYRTYSGVSNRNIPINFVFHNQSGNLDREVVQPGRFLDALKMPLYNAQQRISYPPPTCILHLGALLTARVVLTAGSPTWKGPIDVDTLLPHVCEFAATFTVVRRFQADLGYRFDGRWV